MTTIYCFSGSGHSLAVAEALSGMLNCTIRQIGPETDGTAADDTAVVVFPVYCQNIPVPVKRFLKTLAAKHVALIATYGRISYGNVLFEAQNLIAGDVIAGAYVPTGHTFLDEAPTFPVDRLRPLAERIIAPRKLRLPKTRKDLLADLFPALRSRIGVKIIRSGQCSHCGRCEAACPMGAIQNGVIGSRCIRCLRCVTSCPQNALRYQNSWVLSQYLKRYHKDDFVLYL